MINKDNTDKYRGYLFRGCYSMGVKDSHLSFKVAGVGILEKKGKLQISSDWKLFASGSWRTVTRSGTLYVIGLGSYLVFFLVGPELEVGTMIMEAGSHWLFWSDYYRGCSLASCSGCYRSGRLELYCHLGPGHRPFLYSVSQNTWTYAE